MCEGPGRRTHSFAKYANEMGHPQLPGPPAKGDHRYFHFHVEFLPIQRSATKLKYLAAVESGNGTFLNDTRPEEEAEKLRRTEPLV